MPEMSMNRVIHAAVRRDLDRFTGALSTPGDNLLTQFDAEHDQMAAALESADQAMRSWRGTPSAENVTAAREAVATLRATTTEHLDHEEAELEPFYLEHAHTPEMKAMGRAFGREYKLPEAGTCWPRLPVDRSDPGHTVGVAGRPATSEA